MPKYGRFRGACLCGILITSTCVNMSTFSARKLPKVSDDWVVCQEIIETHKTAYISYRATDLWFHEARLVRILAYLGGLLTFHWYPHY